MKKINRFLCIALVLVFACGLLAGCGKKKDGSTFTVAGSTEIDTLNPLSSYKMSSYEIFLLVYDPLVRFDKTWDSVPCLAESWEVSDDNLTWTFHLAKNVKWHDGKPFTSADVKFTYDLVLETALAYMYEGLLAGISEVSCPDDNTVVMKTDEPKPNMLYITLPVLPKHIWEAVPAEELESFTNAECVGTGPYKFDQMGDGGFVRLVRNDAYFSTGGNVQNIVYVPYSNLDSMAQALMLGEVDAAHSLAATQLALLKNEKNITVTSGETPGFTQIGINMYDDPANSGNPLLREKAVRQAIEYAVDKQKIVDMVYSGGGIEGTTLINPGSEFHYTPDNIRSYNTAAAEKLLEDAGYTDQDGDGIRETADGTPLKFELICIADNVEELRAGQIIAGGCKDAGIAIDLVTMDDGALQDEIDAHSYDMFIWGWGADVDPTYILSILRSDNIGGNNEPGFNNPEYDNLYTGLATEMDEAKRIAIAQEMQKIAYEEAPYILLLYDNNTQGYRSDRWTGIVPVPAETGVYFFANSAHNYLNVTRK